jgi:hypothetical protein
MELVAVRGSNQEQRLDEPRNNGAQSILLEIESLVKRKDNFSLICMLRSHGNRQFGSVVSLMRLVREGERNSKKSIELALFRPQKGPLNYK